MYLMIKLIHLISVIVFLGNITTGLFWHAHAARTRDPMILAHTMEGIIRSDRLFTVPGVIGIVISGIAAAIYGQFPILGTGWILWTIILFTISGIIFAFVVSPLQRQMFALAKAGTPTGKFEYARYRALALRWEIWGAGALLTPFAGLLLMVLKPLL